MKAPKLKREPVPGQCAAARCREPSTLTDATKRVWPVDVELCDHHFETRPEPIERDPFLRVVAMSAEAAIAFVGPTAVRAVCAGVPSDRRKWNPGARLFHVFTSEAKQ